MRRRGLSPERGEVVQQQAAEDGRRDSPPLRWPKAEPARTAAWAADDLQTTRRRLQEAQQRLSEAAEHVRRVQDEEKAVLFAEQGQNDQHFFVPKEKRPSSARPATVTGSRQDTTTRPHHSRTHHEDTTTTTTTRVRPPSAGRGGSERPGRPDSARSSRTGRAQDPLDDRLDILQEIWARPGTPGITIGVAGDFPDVELPQQERRRRSFRPGGTLNNCEAWGEYAHAGYHTRPVRGAELLLGRDQAPMTGSQRAHVLEETW